MRGLAALALVLLPLAGQAQDAAPRVIGVLDSARVIVERAGQTYVCALSETEGAYSAEDCQPLTISMPDLIADRALFIRVFEMNGCEISDEDARGILLPLGFEEAQVRHLIEELQAEGLLELDPGSRAILKTGKCK